MSVLTLKVPAAASVAARMPLWSWFPEFHKTATRVADGTASFRSWSPFPLNSTLRSDHR